MSGFEEYDKFPEVMTTSEVVKFLRITRKTVLKLVHDGKIPARKVGKNFRFLKSEIEQFLRGSEDVNYFSN